MRINYYAINLDRSPERWAAISADAAKAGLTLIRVAGVDGKAMPEETTRLLDREAFRRDHGKEPMLGEVGCYASHLKALATFLQGDAEAAVILEDDAVPHSDMPAVLAAVATVDDWDLVKLKNNRITGFRLERSVSGSHRLGRAPFGPTGSAAAYLVNRRGAQALVKGLRPMTLPLDIAFERGWALGIRVRHLVPDLVSINPATKASLTRAGQRYPDMNLKPWQRLTTLAFRAQDAARRLAYAFGSGG